MHLPLLSPKQPPTKSNTSSSYLDLLPPNTTTTSRPTSPTASTHSTHSSYFDFAPRTTPLDADQPFQLFRNLFGRRPGSITSASTSTSRERDDSRSESSRNRLSPLGGEYNPDALSLLAPHLFPQRPPLPRIESETPVSSTFDRGPSPTTPTTAGTSEDLHPHQPVATSNHNKYRLSVRFSGVSFSNFRIPEALSPLDESRRTSVYSTATVGAPEYRRLSASTTPTPAALVRPANPVSATLANKSSPTLGGFEEEQQRRSCILERTGEGDSDLEVDRRSENTRTGEQELVVHSPTHTFGGSHNRTSQTLLEIPYDFHSLLFPSSQRVSGSRRLSSIFHHPPRSLISPTSWEAPHTPSQNHRSTQSSFLDFVQDSERDSPPEHEDYRAYISSPCEVDGDGFVHTPGDNRFHGGEQEEEQFRDHKSDLSGYSFETKSAPGDLECGRSTTDFWPDEKDIGIDERDHLIDAIRRLSTQQREWKRDNTLVQDFETEICSRFADAPSESDLLQSVGLEQGGQTPIERRNSESSRMETRFKEIWGTSNMPLIDVQPPLSPDNSLGSRSLTPPPPESQPVARYSPRQTIISPARPHSFYISKGPQPNVLAIGGASLGQKASGVGESPALSPRGMSGEGTVESPTKGLGALWGSLRGSRSGKRTTSDARQPYTAPPAYNAVKVQEKQIYGLGPRSPSSIPGRLNVGYSFPNASQQTLRQQKSFKNLSNVPAGAGYASHSAQSSEASRRMIPETSPTDLNYLEPFSTQRPIVSSVSAPYNLTVDSYSPVAAVRNAGLRPSESNPDFHSALDLVSSRRPSGAGSMATTDGRPSQLRADSNDRVATIRKVASSSGLQIGTQPVVERNDRTIAKKASELWTTPSQIMPRTMKWVPATTCDQFVLPKPKLVAHPVSPPPSPEAKPKVVIIGDQHAVPSTPQERGRASMGAKEHLKVNFPPSPVPSYKRVLREGEDRDKEREEWSRIAETSSRYRSLSVGGQSRASRTPRPSAASSGPKNSAEQGGRKRSGSLGQVFRRRPSVGAPNGTSQVDPSGPPQISPPITTSFGAFFQGPPGSRRGSFSHAARESFSRMWSPVERKRTMSEQQGTAWKGKHRAQGSDPSNDFRRAGSRLPYSASGMSQSASSPNLLRMDLAAPFKSRSDEEVFVIGQTRTKRPSEFRYSQKPLPDLPMGASSPVFHPNRQVVGSSLGVSAASPSPSSPNPQPIWLSTTSSAVPHAEGRLSARAELERVHRRKMAQRAAASSGSSAASSPRIPFPSEAAQQLKESYAERMRQKGVPTPERLPLETALALASRVSSSPRLRKSSMEEAVYRGRHSVTSPVMSPRQHSRNGSASGSIFSGSDSEHNHQILEAAGIATPSPLNSSDGKGQFVSESLKASSDHEDTTGRPSREDSEEIVFSGTSAVQPEAETTQASEQIPFARAQGSGPMIRIGSGSQASSDYLHSSIPEPRQLYSIRQAANQERLLVGSPASTIGSSPGGRSPMVDDSSSDLGVYSDLFFEHPSRQWGNPVALPTRSSSAFHTRSASMPPAQGADVEEEPEVLFGIPGPSRPRSLADDHEDNSHEVLQSHSRRLKNSVGEEEAFSIEVATPVDVPSPELRAPSPFRSLMDPAVIHSAKSTPSTDPRMLLANQKDDDDDIPVRQGVKTKESFSNFFSTSPAISFNHNSEGDHGQHEDSPAWTTTGEQVLPPVRSVSYGFGAAGLSSYAEPTTPRRNRESIVPEVGAISGDSPQTPPQLSVKQSPAQSVPSPAHRAIDRAQAHLSLLSSTGDSDRPDSTGTALDLLGGFPAPPGQTPRTSYNAGDKTITPDRRLSDQDSGAWAIDETRLEQILARNLEDDEQTEIAHGDGAETLRPPPVPAAPVREFAPGLSRTDTEASNVTYETATEGYSSEA